MDVRLSELIGVGDVVVDLGCGSGELLTSLDGKFNQRIGLDVSRRRLDEMVGGCTIGWDFREADLNGRFPLNDASVDVVVANQVIEHIIDPVLFTKEVYRVLRVGGRCIMTTPNIRYAKHILHLCISGYGPRTAGGNTIDGNWDDGHLHYFTHKDLRELFQMVGFKNIVNQALIDVRRGGSLRRMISKYSKSVIIKEFMSGNILLSAQK